MTMGLKANADGSGAIQVGGSDAISITSGLNTTFAGTVTSASTVAGATGTLYPLVARTAQTAPPTVPQYFEFTGIPSWVDRITVMFSGVSHNGSTAFNDQFLIQLGAGSITSSGYASFAVNTSATTGFLITNSVSGASTFSGVLTIALVGGNTWSQSGNISGNTSCQYSAGTVTLGGVLDRIRITTVGGTNSFDAGSVNILYE